MILILDYHPLLVVEDDKLSSLSKTKFGICCIIGIVSCYLGLVNRFIKTVALALHNYAMNVLLLPIGVCKDIEKNVKFFLVR